MTSTKYTWYLGAEKPNTTETVERDSVDQEVAELFSDSGATIREASGTWKGEVEDNFLVEHVADEDFTEEDAERVAEELKERFEQESVMFESEEVSVQFV